MASFKIQIMGLRNICIQLINLDLFAYDRLVLTVLQPFLSGQGKGSQEFGWVLPLENGWTTVKTDWLWSHNEKI